MVEGVLRLNAKPICKFTGNWSISAVPPMPNKSKSGCHVRGRKSIPKRWATAKKEMKSWCGDRVGQFDTRNVALCVKELDVINVSDCFSYVDILQDLM